ncbi:MAG: fibronectin/fibrinogen-binding protein [Clostridiales bacterium]|nr:fibronectin/fibrinogen-binding protein [Clostridiales bacterium]
MPLDAITLAHLTRELDSRLAGARVDKIHMPERQEVLMALRAQEGNVRLLLSAVQSGARLQLTRAARENPKTPPMLCMLLRKHLTGARLLHVRQEPLERVVRIGFEAAGELGDLEQKQLVLELMGRSSNLILLDGAERVLAALSYIDPSEQRSRQLLPGVTYRLPERPDKLDLSQGFEALTHCLQAQEPVPGDRYLLDRVMGLSPLLARECVFRATGAPDTGMDTLSPSQRGALFAELVALFTGEGALPTLLLDGQGTPADFSCTEIRQYGALYRLEQAPDYSTLLDEFYALRERRARLKQSRQQMERLLTGGIERISRKLSAQQAELTAFQDRDRYRIFGELLTANLHRVPPGAASVELPNYYEEGTPPIRIPLEVARSPAANAQRYFKKYQKAKNGERMLMEQLRIGQEELDYLQSVRYALRQADSDSEIAAIREELTQQGYLARPRGAKPQKQRPEQGRPAHFVSSDGFAVLVGRNNAQNDELATRVGRREDWWLHVLGLPGAHVLVLSEGRPVPDRTLEEAAQLAALHSQAAQQDLVPVTYTQLKHVKKPSGARPGSVIYTSSQTAYIRPDPALPQRLAGPGADGAEKPL